MFKLRKNKNNISDKLVYKSFVEQGRLSDFRKVKKLISLKYAAELQNSCQDLNKFFRNPKFQLDCIYIQKLVSHSFKSKHVIRLCKSLGKNRGPVIVSLNYYALTLLIQKGYRIYKFISLISYFLFKLKYCLKSYKSLFDFLFLTKTYKLDRTKVNENTSLLLISDSIKDEFALFSRSNEAENFSSWLKYWVSANNKEYRIIHNIILKQKMDIDSSFLFVKNFKFSLQRQRKIFTYFSIIYFILKSLLLLIVFRTKTAFCIDEIIKKIWFSNSVIQDFNYQVFYTESQGIIRPLWTYSCELNKNNVIYVFTSTYDSPSTNTDDDPRIDFWPLSTWQRFVACDTYQANFLKNIGIFPAENCIEGLFFTPYLDSGSPLKINANVRFIITLFDLPASRNNYYGISTYNDVGFSNHELQHRFLELGRLLSEIPNSQIIYKQKREVSSTLEFCSQCLEICQLNVTEVPSHTGVFRLVKKSNLVISAPFTTTAFIADSLNVKSIFYDPIGKVLKFDPARRNLRIFDNKAQIRELALQIMKESAN